MKRKMSQHLLFIRDSSLPDIAQMKFFPNFMQVLELNLRGQTQESISWKPFSSQAEDPSSREWTRPWDLAYPAGRGPRGSWVTVIVHLTPLGSLSDITHQQGDGGFLLGRGEQFKEFSCQRPERTTLFQVGSPPNPAWVRRARLQLCRSSSGWKLGAWTVEPGVPGSKPVSSRCSTCRIREGREATSWACNGFRVS